MRLPRPRRASGAEVIEAFQSGPEPPAPAPGGGVGRTTAPGLGGGRCVCHSSHGRAGSCEPDRPRRPEGLLAAARPRRAPTPAVPRPARRPSGAAMRVPGAGPGSRGGARRVSHGAPRSAAQDCGGEAVALQAPDPDSARPRPRPRAPRTPAGRAPGRSAGSTPWARRPAGSRMRPSPPTSPPTSPSFTRPGESPRQAPRRRWPRRTGDGDRADELQLLAEHARSRRAGARGPPQRWYASHARCGSGSGRHAGEDRRHQLLLEFCAALLHRRLVRSSVDRKTRRTHW